MFKNHLVVPFYATCSLLCLTILNANAATQQVTQVAQATSIKPQATAPTDTRQKLLAAANTLIKAGKPKEAYTLLTPYQSQFAGDENFDYLLGIAALDSAKPNEAIFALERVLAVNPGHLQARAEIARAYLAAGEIDASRQEFETVKQQNPPKEVSATIQKYLDIIETHRTDKKTSFRAYIETAMGYDSNVNSATASRQIAIPFFGGAIMDMNADGVENKDSFGSIATGFNARYALSPTWALLGGANINQRANAEMLTYDTRNIDGNLGLSYSQGDNSYSVVAQGQSFVLDRKSYRDAYGMTGQWQHNLANGRQASVYLQYTNLFYPERTTNNADRYVMGGAYAMPLGAANTSSAFVGLYGGAETPQKTGVAYLGNTLYGLRTGGEIKLSPQTTLLASASIENRIYGGKDLLFLTIRNDTQTELRLALAYVPAKLWTITPSVNYTHNNSNIIINKYERTLLSLSARRDFD